MKESKISTFYNQKMSLKDGDMNYSKSPTKPRRMMEYLKNNNLSKYFDIIDFEPFTKNDFLIAHKEQYVEAFFDGKKPLCETSGLKWSPEFAETVTYTNASLYYSILNSIKKPKEVSLSLTSGFHHAHPDGGEGFCTFSGQAIASLKIYRNLGLRGVYIDLDGHYGNSIEDTRSFVPEMSDAVPHNCNINVLARSGFDYLDELETELVHVKKMLIAGSVDYVVFCHGADSHRADDFTGVCTTDEWIKCSKMVYQMINDIENETNKHIPLTICLFGGYRSDDYNSVLGLHTADLLQCLKINCGVDVNFKPTIHEKNEEYDSYDDLNHYRF